MKAWLPWVLTVGLVATVALVSFINPYAVAAGLFAVGTISGLVIAHVRARSRGGDDADADAHYWRMSSFFDRSR